VQSIEIHRQRARWALVACGVAVVVLGFTYIAVYHFGRVSRLDVRLFDDFGNLDSAPHVNRFADLFAGLCDPGRYEVLAAIPVGIALLRRRPMLALTLFVIVAGAPLSAQILKSLLAAAHPDITGAPIPAGSWPSGHATAATALSLGLVLAAPRRVRPYAAVLGAGFALSVVYSVLVLGWHYPSDALGGIVLASLWAALGIAWLSRREARRVASGKASASVAKPMPWAETLAPPLIAALTALAGLATLVVVRPGATIDYLKSYHVMDIAVAVLALLSVGVATGLAAAFRR